MPAKPTEYRPTVSVDYDATLHPYTRGWTGEEPDDEPPIRGAEQFLAALLEQGYNIVIHTTRARTLEGEQGTIRWFHKYMPSIFYAMRDQGRVAISATKHPSIAYVDDRAVVFRGSYSDCLTDIQALRDRPSRRSS